MRSLTGSGHGWTRPDGREPRQRSLHGWREWHSNGQLAEYSLFNRFGELVHIQRWDEAGTLVEDKKSGITRGLQVRPGVTERLTRAERSAQAP